MPGLSFPIMALIASAILFAPLASWLALQRARSWALWFLFGVALGPIASVLLVLAPPGRCPACGTRTVGWPRSCSNCGLVFGLPAALAPQPAVPATMASGGGGGSAAPAELDNPAPLPAAVAVHRPEPAAAALGPEPTPAQAAPARRSATALGRRPTTVAPAKAAIPSAPASAASEAARSATPRRAPAGTLAILGSGVFIGGSESLQVGSRYLLARVGAELHVLGPVHISPAAVAARVALSGVEPTLLADRLLITSTKPGRGSDLAFGGVHLETGVDVRRDLRASRRGRPASS